MNRRASQARHHRPVVATLGVIAAPGVTVADPIGDKQAEAQQLEAQINGNAEKLSGLNEQMHSTQNELDRGERDIRAADALVAAAKAKTKELRDEVAAAPRRCTRRAVPRAASRSSTPRTRRTCRRSRSTARSPRSATTRSSRTR